MHPTDEEQFRVLGRLICRRMSTLKWTIAGLASLAGISHTTLVKLRCGKIGIGTRALMPVCRILGIKFIGGEALPAKHYVGRLPYQRAKKQRRKAPDPNTRLIKLPDGRKVYVPIGQEIGHIPRKRPSAA